MRVLITGITGFVGPHLAEHALSQGAEVFGTLRWRSNRGAVAPLGSRVTLLECELRDPASVLRLIQRVRPDRIIHLAAQSFVPASMDAPHETFASNVDSTLNLLEAMRLVGGDIAFLNVGSSEEYGLVHPDEVPVTEENPLRPNSPYAVSKVAQDLLGYQYAVSYQMRVFRTRAFNHVGPGQSDVFVLPTFARQIAEIEAGKREAVLHVGNLDARRDFTDVRDVVRAYWLVLERGAPGEVYNVCSGQAPTIREALEGLLALAKVRSISVRPDPHRMRPSDAPIVCGDFRRLAAATGWRPEIPFTRTLEDILEDWRRRVNGR